MSGVPASSHGGSQPVSCALFRYAPLDVAASGAHPITWDYLADNIVDQNEIDAIPAGLGLSFAFDGSDAQITTTEAGVWAFLLIPLFAAHDATWEGHLNGSGAWPAVQSSAAGQTPLVVLSEVVALPAYPNLFGYSIQTSVAATALTFEISPFMLAITRLA